MTGIDMYLFVGCNLYYIMTGCIIFFLILNLGKHPFLNKSGMVNHKNQLGGGEGREI
jgi:hypothetical protein